MDKVKICLIGAGRAGEVHGDVYNLNIPDSEIVAIIDKDKNKLNKLGKKYGIDKGKLFTDFDLIPSEFSIDGSIITTPTFTHKDLVIKSANKGINVFCEKPMAITLGECNQMIEACNSAGIIFQIGFMRRFDKGFMFAKETISNGDIGRPIIIKSNGRGPGLPGKWALDQKNSNGIIAEVNSHDIDSIRWLSGSEYKEIHAYADNFKTSDIKKDYKDFYDSVIVSGKLKDDTLFMIDGVCPCDYGYDARTEIIGTKGVMFIGEIYNGSGVICTREKGITSPQVLSWRERFKDAYIAEDRHFIECIRNNLKPHVTAEDGRYAVITAVAVNESIRTGKSIQLI